MTDPPNQKAMTNTTTGIQFDLTQAAATPAVENGGGYTIPKRSVASRQDDNDWHESTLTTISSSMDHNTKSHLHQHKEYMRKEETEVEHAPDERTLRPDDDYYNDTTKQPEAYYTEGLKNPGWLTVLGTFLLNIYTWGVVSSWGVFQVLYLKVYAGQTDEARISFVGTSANAIILALGLVGTPIIQRFHYRGTIFIGAVICCPLSQILASFATELWEVFLTLGCMFGFGAGLCYIASSTLPSQWFFRRRGLASGIASCGACVGPMVFSPLTQSLITNMGYRNALRVLAAIGFATCCLGVVLIRPRYPPPSSSSSSLESEKQKQSKWWQRILSLDRAMFTWEYNFYLLHSFLSTFGYLPPFILAQTYASELGADPAFAAIFVSILEAGNGSSRIIFGWLGDQWLGRINVLFLTTLVSGIFTSVIWQNAITIHIFVIYCVLFGFTGGVFSGLQPVISAEIVGVDRIQEGVGVSYFLSLFGILTGTPIMGSLHLHYGWTAAIQFTGAMTIASAMAVLGTRFLMNKRLLAKV